MINNKELLYDNLKFRMLFKKIAKKILSKNSKLNTKVSTWKFELEHKQDFSKNSQEEIDFLVKIKENGYTVIPNYFDKDFCDKCIKDIDKMLANKKEFIREDSEFDYRIFGAEHLSENIKKFADHPFFSKLAHAYNAKPTINAFTLAARLEAHGQEFGSGGSWHKDSALRQFKSIVYLTDADENSGPFQIIAKSNNSSYVKEDNTVAQVDSMECRFDVSKVDKIIAKNPDRLKTITGKAGSVVLVDSSCIHRGIPIKEGVRYALTNYFFEKDQVTPSLIEHFSPLVSPESVLEKVQN